MFRVKRVLQFSMLVLVLTSGMLLGLSQRNLELTAIATLGAIAGYLVTDVTRWFQLRGMIANIASIAVLFYAMKDFFGGDGGAKLICVSNLLVYLQTVLMFQEKTPRLNWQLMVLSLLQIVVAAIFNLNFEGGLLFVFYFAVVGLTMILQTLYSNNCEIINQNRRSAARVGQYLRSRESLVGEGASNQAIPFNGNRPVAFYEAVQHSASNIGKVVQHLLLWLIAALVFSTILFYIIPRGGDAWFGPNVVAASGTGMTKHVDLDERGLIEQSTALVMRGWFEDRVTGERFKPKGTIYFRGLALGSLTNKDRNTDWTAPYDRVFMATYQKVRTGRAVTNKFVQKVTLQPTNDPLIYATMPVFRSVRTPEQIEFAFEISALSRRNGNDLIERSPYSYELDTAFSNEREPLKAWPYLADQYKIDDQPMHTHNLGQRAWLTEINPDRYPTLVGIAKEISQRAGFANRLNLVTALEQHFSQSDLYSYTLDFAGVPRVENLDPVEDFVRNHKSGHCELYASALTLMLRSLDIPARLVVGFIGSEYDEDNNLFLVRECDAHAWVEVYLRPKDCTRKMYLQGEASSGGAWLRLDPTPPGALENPNRRGSTAIESARTLWQDYVLGLDATKQDETVFGTSSARVLGLFDLSNWNRTFQAATDQLERRPAFRVAIASLILLAVVIGLMQGWKSRKAKTKRQSSNRSVGGFRRILGGALALISPHLGMWVLGESPHIVSSWFYHRLTKALEKVGLVRQPSQTQREFAVVACQKLADSPDADSISDTIQRLTDLYYRVRFGSLELDSNRLEQVNQMLETLERKLQNIQASHQTGRRH